LIDRADGTYCFRENKNRVYYVSEKILLLSTNVPPDKLVTVGTCFGKFTKTGKFILHITALTYLAPYAQVRILYLHQLLVYDRNDKTEFGGYLKSNPVNLIKELQLYLVGGGGEAVKKEDENCPEAWHGRC
jgi:ribosome biogenesis protein Nip4